MKLIYNKDLLNTYPYNGLKLCKNDYVLQEGEYENNSFDILNNELNENSLIKMNLKYTQIKDILTTIGTNFNSLDEQTKENVVKFCCISKTGCTNYYSQKGFSNDECEIKYIENKADDLYYLKKCTQFNISSKEFTKILLTYLSYENYEKFIFEIKDLLFLYKNFEIYGKKYGNYVNGIMDFIEDYDIYDNVGLSKYSILNGKTLNNLILELKIVLLNDADNDILY